MKPEVSVDDAVPYMDTDVLTAAIAPNSANQVGFSCYLRERIFFGML